MSAELSWGAMQADFRERLACPWGSPPPYPQHAVEADAELYWRGGPDDDDPPESPVLRYEWRGSECGECRMYTFAGAFASVEAAREGRS